MYVDRGTVTQVYKYRRNDTLGLRSSLVTTYSNMKENTKGKISL